MITHRPVTGSRLNSGIECVLINLDRRLARVDMDRDDVETARAVRQPTPRHVVQRELRDPAALERCDRLRRVPDLPPFPRLHLDEPHRLAVARDYVNFSAAAAIAPGDNCVSALPKLRAGEIFAVF